MKMVNEGMVKMEIINDLIPFSCGGAICSLQGIRTKYSLMISFAYHQWFSLNMALMYAKLFKF